MKYRIKIITFANGRKEYIAQKKRGFIWLNLGYDGDIYNGLHFPNTVDLNRTFRDY